MKRCRPSDRTAVVCCARSFASISARFFARSSLLAVAGSVLSLSTAAATAAAAAGSVFPGVVCCCSRRRRCATALSRGAAIRRGELLVVGIAAVHGGLHALLRLLGRVWAYRRKGWGGWMVWATFSFLENYTSDRALMFAPWLIPVTFPIGAFKGSQPPFLLSTGVSLAQHRLFPTLNYVLKKIHQWSFSSSAMAPSEPILVTSPDLCLLRKSPVIISSFEFEDNVCDMFEHSDCQAAGDIIPC